MSKDTKELLLLAGGAIALYYLYIHYIATPTMTAVVPQGTQPTPPPSAPMAVPSSAGGAAGGATLTIA